MDYIKTLFTPKLVQELEAVSKSVEALMTSPDFMNLLKHGDTRIYVDNPAISFVHATKNGAFDTLSDDEFAALMHNIESACDVFHGVDRVCVGPNKTWQELNGALVNVISNVQALLHIKALYDSARVTVEMYQNYPIRADYNKCEESEDDTDFSVDWDNIQVPDLEVKESGVEDTEYIVEDNVKSYDTVNLFVPGVPDVPVTDDDSDLADFE